MAATAARGDLVKALWFSGEVDIFSDGNNTLDVSCQRNSIFLHMHDKFNGQSYGLSSCVD